MLFQPSNIYPSTFSGIGAGTVDVTQGINVSWQVNGDTPMTAYQIKIYQNDSGSTLMYDSGSVSVSPVFEPHDKNGNATYFTAIISAAALSTAGIVNGYQYGYKMLITQWWGVSDYVEQTSASVFITRSTPTLAINTITTPVASNSLTITANYSQAQGDPISTVEWVFALAGSESTPIRETGAISTQVLSFDADGLITGNTYSIMCKVVTSTGMEASTGFVQFPVSYSSSSLGINYQLAQLKNSSAVYLSWDDLGSNKLAYPYTDTTKTTNGITFTVNGEGDVVATGTATADAYFTIAQGTLSQLGITAGQKFIVTSGYSGAKIVVTETNSSNVVVSTIEGSDPLQYIATSTTNTLKFSIVIPSGSVLSSGQQLKPMIALEDKIVAYNDLSANIEPIQDLHGYASPWPAGGGVNLLDPDKSSRTAASAYGLDITYLGDDTFTIKGQSTTTSANAAFNVLTYSDMSLSGLGYVIQAFIVNDKSNNYKSCYGFRTSTENKIAVVLDCSASQDVDITLKLSVSTASQASWTPYSNICPISGRTGVSVYDDPKYGGSIDFNQYADNESTTGNHFAETWATTLSIANGVITATNTRDFTQLGLNFVEKDVIIQSDHVFLCSFDVVSVDFTVSTVTLNITDHWAALISSPSKTYTGVGTYSFVVKTYASGTAGNAQRMLIRLNGSVTTGDKASFKNCLWFDLTQMFGSTKADEILAMEQAEAGSGVAYFKSLFPKEYYAYNSGTTTCVSAVNGDPYWKKDIDWTTEAGTVYGGTLDVVTGVLTVDRAMVIYNGTESMQPNGQTANTSRFSIAVSGKANGTTNLISDRFSAEITTDTAGRVSGRASNNGIEFFLPSSVPQTIQGGKDWFTANPTQIVYELATPLTYQLTATQVAVLAGTNNVWSTGDSVSVTYTKDTGSQATLSGAIVTFSDSNAVLIPTPQYIPGITGISIYRYLQGESALQHVYDLATGATSILDYYAPSQMQVSYLIVAHSGIGDLFLQTTKFTPTFWFFSILLCDTDSNGDYHVSKEYIFKYGVETGAVSNNNDPTIQKNFTPYPNRQPISSLYKTGKLTSYIGKTNSQNQYSDSVSLQNAIYDISTSPLTKFLKTRKGDILMIDTAAAIQMKTEDATTQQALRATVDWVEVGDASNKSIVSVPTDSFWPISANL